MPVLLKVVEIPVPLDRDLGVLDRRDLPFVVITGGISETDPLGHLGTIREETFDHHRRFTLFTEVQVDLRGASQEEKRDKDEGRIATHGQKQNFQLIPGSGPGT